MGVSLSKGGSVSLTKAAPHLDRVFVALGWEASSVSGVEYDLDASALVVGPDGRVLSDRHFIFYGNLVSPDGAIEHTGDNLVGGGEDDEVIYVTLSLVPANVDRIVFPVSIYDADVRGQSFGRVSNAYIRVVDRSNGNELARYDLSSDASTESAVVFGELYRSGGEWSFKARGDAYASGLAGIAREHGVNVG